MSPVQQKIIRLTIKSLVGVMLVLLLAMLLLFWRLSSSPIELNQLIPRIEQVASDLPGGLSVRLKGIGLFWNRTERHVDLRALSVELVESSGSTLVSVPEVNISISGFALLRGVVALSSIDLRGVDIQLVRREDGSFQIFKRTGAEVKDSNENPPRNQMETVQHLFKVLASEANTDHPLSYLKRLEISGSIHIEDRENGLTWSAYGVESLFIGHKGRVEGLLGVTFSSPQALNGIHTDISLDLQDDDVTARLEFSGVRPSGFAALDQRLAALTGLDISLDGNIDTSLTLPDKVHSLSASIKGEAGRFSYDEYFTKGLRIDALQLNVSADLPGKSLQVSSLDLHLGEASDPLKLQLQGSAKMVENAVAVRLGTALQGLKAAEFDIYWPRAVAQGARQWLVNNLQAGVVESAKLDLVMQVPTTAESRFQLGELKGSLGFRDLKVTYFGDLPAATGVTGAGTFDRHGFDLDIRAGQVKSVNIAPGKVIINGLDNKKAAISVKTHLQGPLANVFAVLEAPPIKLNSDSITGLASEQLGGQVEADFGIALPLRSGLTDGDIRYQASGRISDGSFRKFYRDYDLQEANLDFDLDSASKIHFNGPLAFSGVPLTMEWTTMLAGADEGHADFSIDSPAITGVQVSALGYDVGEYMQGSFALQTKAKLAPGGPVTASIAADFNNAALAIPKVHWSKPAGGGGNIGFTLLLEKQHMHAGNINVSLGNIKTSGNVEVDITGPIMSLTMENLSLSYAQLRGLKLERNENKALQFSVQGGEVSLEPFLSGDSGQADPLKKQVTVESQAIARELKSAGYNFEIAASKLDKVYLDKETYFDNIHFSSHFDSRGVQQLNLSGHNRFASGRDDTGTGAVAAGKPGAGQFRLVYGPPENGRYPLQLEAEDFGSLVSAVKGGNIMKGGYLVLDGESQGALLTKPISGNFKMSGFTVKEAPAITKVLNLASLTQIISTLRQTGLAFNSASGDLQLDGARLSSKQVRINGGSLGLSVSGWADLRQKDLELSGTVIPLSKINNIIGKIPLLGQVVVGQDGKGIMAVDYTVKGSIGQPDVSIRKAPLTTGILKNTLGEESVQVSPDKQ